MFERSFLYAPRLVSLTSESRQIKGKLDVASSCPAVAISSVLDGLTSFLSSKRIKRTQSVGADAHYTPFHS